MRHESLKAAGSVYFEIYCWMQGKGQQTGIGRISNLVTGSSDKVYMKNGIFLRD
jgi:hypothetical protein